MKTKDELSEDVGLVRDLEAWCNTVCADDIERGFRDALFRKAFVELPKMQMPHVRRINEAICAMDFPTHHALGLKRQLIEVLSRHHKLRDYRNVKMPLIQPPQPAK